MLTRASLLSCSLSLPSHHARASCNYAGSANPCEITFLQLEIAGPSLSSLLQSCRICKPVRAYFPATQVCRACSLVPLATLAGSAHSCEFTFLHLKFAEPPRSCLMQPCRVSRATSLVPLATLLGLLTRASLISCTEGSPSHLTCAFCNLARCANPCKLNFLHRKFAEPPRSCLLQPCPVRRPTSLVPLATMPGVLTRASLLSCTASSPSHLARASCNLARCANPCEINFLQRKFAEPTRWCLLKPCRVF
ncbi:hypothetical protein CRG98_008258 [Punica granatum]|uniref:Secreted protein n=1 Tax=Punica granatum TaxID=22663 RepID=A0A2I0KU19_PUNGR|nr:hypothetical protein CRG98_008258 [Punica granatum]